MADFFHPNRTTQTVIIITGAGENNCSFVRNARAKNERNVTGSRLGAERRFYGRTKRDD